MSRPTPDSVPLDESPGGVSGASSRSPNLGFPLTHPKKGGGSARRAPTNWSLGEAGKPTAEGERR